LLRLHAGLVILLRICYMAIQAPLVFCHAALFNT
jgi:hypothetical protein